MGQASPFQNNVERYEQWFSKYHWAYEAELRAVKSLLPIEGQGVEVGVGTGRFASPLGITTGIEPVFEMGKIAQNRGINVFRGMAENLPLSNSAFDFILMVTTICFIDDINKALQEAYRVLTVKGHLIVAIIDRDSPLGHKYEKSKNDNIFYENATFYSTAELVEIMGQSDFRNFDFRQTIFKQLLKVPAEEQVKKGYGEGSFVVIRCQKNTLKE